MNFNSNNHTIMYWNEINKTYKNTILYIDAIIINLISLEILLNSIIEFVFYFFLFVFKKKL